MDQFELLGKLALKLHGEFRSMYYLLLPIFFSLAIALAWFRHPQGGPDFIDAFKRTVIATLLSVGFPEITDTILFVANGIADKISDMSGIETVMQMASEKAKSYTLSTTSVVLAFNDLLVAVLAFLSYIILYVARFIMVALYHFSWVFLSLIAPLLLLFHVFGSKITSNLFRSLFEVASWKIVWAVLSAMLTALPFGNAYVADGNYLTVIVLNFVIALSMLGTPLLVRSLVGSGLSAMTSAMGPAVATAMIAAPAKAASMTRFGKEMLSDTIGYSRFQGQKLASGISSLLPKTSAPPNPSASSSPNPPNQTRVSPPQMKK